MPGHQLLVGKVMHRRLRPVAHRFAYPVFALRLRLGHPTATMGSWFGIDRLRPLSLRTRDYGPRDGSDLLLWIRQVLRRAGLPADGAVFLQTMPRIFGYAFNPVSCWYCHDAAGALRAVLAEVNNTFGEHHCYLLSAPDRGAIVAGTELSCVKRLHVSPFFSTRGRYRFQVVQGKHFARLVVDYYEAGELMLRTSIGGRMQPATAGALRRAVCRQPLLTVSVTARIHWQALRLWLKGLRVHRKPLPPADSFSRGTE